MTLRNVGVGFSFTDHTRPISGDEGQTVRSSDRKLVTRQGAAKRVADFDVNKDLVDEGDFETGEIDVGGTSGIAIALVSAQSNSMEVQVDLLDDNGNVGRTIDSTDFANLSGPDIVDVIPVFSDRLNVRVVDTSGGADNDVSGSININIGAPTEVSTTVTSGDVQIRGADNNLFEEEALNASAAATSQSMVTYLARALDSQSLDEFVSRVTDSGGTQIDPLTQDVTQTRSNDELRTRLYGVDTTASLTDIRLAELQNSPAASAVSQLTYLARALQSQGLDELVSRVTDSTGSQVDPLTQDATTAVGNTELRTDQQAGQIANLRADAEFVASYRATGVADTNTAFTVVVSNPGGSGVDTVVTPTFATGGAAYLDVAEDVSISTSGTALSTLPRDTMSGSSPAATIERDGSYTVNGTTITSLLPGTSRSGGPTATQGSESPATGAYLLEPGDSVYYQVVNQSGGSADFDVELSLVER